MYITKKNKKIIFLINEYYVKLGRKEKRSWTRGSTPQVPAGMRKLSVTSCCLGLLKCEI